MDTQTRTLIDTAIPLLKQAADAVTQARDLAFEARGKDPDSTHAYNVWVEVDEASVSLSDSLRSLEVAKRK